MKLYKVMITKMFKLRTFVALIAIAAVAFTFSACQKEQLTGGKNAGTKVELSDAQKRKIETLGAKIPVVRLWDQEKNRYIDLDILNRKKLRNWTFANPTQGYTYSATGTWSNADGTQMVVLTISGTSSSSGGGTVVAGNSALNIDYAFCFSVDVEAVGVDLFDFGGDFDGVSGVIGIAGDFEALANDELGDDPNFEDFFEGFAAYYVYDSQANGTYDVLNWFEDLDSDPDDLENKSFSFVLDFQQFGIYFSKSGSIAVSGASMNFNGTYLALGEFLLSFDEEEEGSEPEVTEVFGYGEMGCN